MKPIVITNMEVQFLLVSICSGLLGLAKHTKWHLSADSCPRKAPVIHCIGMR